VDVLQQRVAQQDVVAGPPTIGGDALQPGPLRRRQRRSPMTSW
jgi:hypothetical protein